MSQTQPTIYIRVDGNETIATGHVMRCLSIAVQLKKQGCNVVFLTADNKPAELIRSRGFTTDILNTDWNHLDYETDILCKYLQSHHARVLLLDSYQVTYDYLATLSQIVKVVYIDDLNQFPYPVHTVINYSVWAEKGNYLRTYQNPKSVFYSLSHKTACTNEHSEPSDSPFGAPLPHFLLGGSYIPLREEFSYIPRVIQPEITNVLITMGGTDSYNVAGKLLKSLFEEKSIQDSKKMEKSDSTKTNPAAKNSTEKYSAGKTSTNEEFKEDNSEETGKTELQTLNYHIIVGIFNQHKDELHALAKQYPNIHLYENVSNMSDYMRLCDAAISAGGSTLYELCACGTPTICMEIADNQNGASIWEEYNYMLYAGNIVNNEEACLTTCLSHLSSYIHNYHLRKSFSEHMQQLVDGQGAARIASYCHQISIQTPEQPSNTSIPI